MKILHVPHPALRKTATQVNEINDQVKQFISNLEEVLQKKENPKGVGLSAPQVGSTYSIFTTFLTQNTNDEPVLCTYINPKIVSSSKNRTLGSDQGRPILEGCLSIPNIYGPVPRYEWVELQYQKITDEGLKTQFSTFYAFEARVIQHEYDHLNGVLFTDYSLEYDLPLYNDATGKMIKISNKMAQKY